MSKLKTFRGRKHFEKDYFYSNSPFTKFLVKKFFERKGVFRKERLFPNFVTPYLFLRKKMGFNAKTAEELTYFLFLYCLPSLGVK